MTEQPAASPEKFNPAPEHSESISADPLSLPSDQQEIVRWITRERDLTLTQLAEHLGQAQATLQPALKSLVELGLIQQVETNGVDHYRPHLGKRQGRKVSPQIWQSLED